MRGLVSRLLKQSFVDGPGNRAVVFLQGCQLRCSYCHNPQTQQVCIGCGICVDGCPGGALSPDGGGPLRWDSSRCIGCDRCIHVCPHLADPRAQALSVDDLTAWLRPLLPFISGVTVSGGEPLLQADFVLELCRRVREMGRTTIIETNALFSPEVLEPLLPWLDGALIDIKVWDAAAHVALTGAPHNSLEQNLRRLASLGKLTEVRIPVIPGYSDTVANVTATAAFVASLDPQIPLRLQRFRSHGTRGPAAAWASPSDETMATLMAAARTAGLTRVVQSR